MAEQIFRWGILGAGGIAEQFARDLMRLPDQRPHAVGSRSQEKADNFADLFAMPNRHDSYAKLVADPEVDGIYVATHHPMHMRDTVMALNAGKPVLCEKPFAMNFQETKTMIETARAKNLLLMEAMWARFLPHMIQVREVIKSGVLGEIIQVRADHGQWFVKDPEFRLFKPELGGGSLLDLGIYPISFASMVLGTPSRVTARSTKGFTGVDGQTSVILEYPTGAHALLNMTNSAATPNRAVIVGSDARIEIARTFYQPTTFKVIDHKDQIIGGSDKKYVGHGLREEAIEFVRCYRAGLKESPILPLDETLSIMGTVTEVADQIGLVFKDLAQ